MNTFEEAMEILSRPPAKPVKGRGFKRSAISKKHPFRHALPDKKTRLEYYGTLCKSGHAATIKKNHTSYWYVSTEAGQALSKFAEEFAAMIKLTQ